MESLQGFIENHGLLAVLVGCLLEGETVLVLAGFAAHMGYLSLPEVPVTAALAGLAGDQAPYTAGRRWGEALFARVPVLAARVRVARPPRRTGRVRRSRRPERSRSRRRSPSACADLAASA
ncbi:Inner membrane protein YohD [Burkholderiales bacterium]|nr:Inner membrane protein YohD [Burkholderiales bacterium]